MGFFRSLGRLFGGRKPKAQQVKRFTPQQESALNQLMSRGMAATDMGGLEKKYRGLFERDVVPGLAERFTAMGGGQRSSSFEESLRRGGLGLSEQLAGLEHQGGMQALGLGMQPRFDTVMTPGSPGLLQGLMGGVSGMLGMGLGGSIGRRLGLGMFQKQQGAGQASQPQQGTGYGMGWGMGQRHPYSPLQGRYIPGQPKGMQKGYNPVLLKIIEGLQL